MKYSHKVRLRDLVLFIASAFKKNGSLVKNTEYSKLFFFNEGIRTKGEFRLISKRKTRNLYRFIPLTSIQVLKTECRLRSELPRSQSRNGNVYSSKVTFL